MKEGGDCPFEEEKSETGTTFRERKRELSPRGVGKERSISRKKEKGKGEKGGKKKRRKRKEKKKKEAIPTSFGGQALKGQRVAYQLKRGELEPFPGKGKSLHRYA